MIGEIIAIGAIGAVTYTALDYANILPWSKTADGSNKWFWEKPPFQTVRAMPIVRPTMFSRPLPPVTKPLVMETGNGYIVTGNAPTQAPYWQSWGGIGKYR